MNYILAITLVVLSLSLVLAEGDKDSKTGSQDGLRPLPSNVKAHSQIVKKDGRRKGGGRSRDSTDGTTPIPNFSTTMQSSGRKDRQRGRPKQKVNVDPMGVETKKVCASHTDCGKGSCCMPKGSNPAQKVCKQFNLHNKAHCRLDCSCAKDLTCFAKARKSNREGGRCTRTNKLQKMKSKGSILE